MDGTTDLRATFDLLSQRVAQAEHTYRDLGIKFFTLPVLNRAQYFRVDCEDAVRTFARLEGDGHGMQHVSVHLTEVRAWLDQIRNHLRRQEESEAAKAMLITAQEFYAVIKRQVYPWVPKMGGVYLGGLPRIPMSFTANLIGGGLPADEGDERYVDFRRWALTVREVQNFMALGMSEDEAVAKLGVKTPEIEDCLLPDPGEVHRAWWSDDDDKGSDDDESMPGDSGYEGDAESNASSDSNPWEGDFSSEEEDGEEQEGGVPVGNQFSRPGTPPPAVEFR